MVGLHRPGPCALEHAGVEVVSDIDVAHPIIVIGPRHHIVLHQVVVGPGDSYCAIVAENLPKGLGWSTIHELAEASHVGEGGGVGPMRKGDIPKLGWHRAPEKSDATIGLGMEVRAHLNASMLVGG